MEQGSHKELVALDGIFASMWADQVSSTEDPAISLSDDGTKKEISGYSIEQVESAPIVEELQNETSAASENQKAIPLQGTPPTVPESLPTEGVPTAHSMDQGDMAEPSLDLAESSPIPFTSGVPTDFAFPSIDSASSPAPAASEPLAFPASDDTVSQQHSERTPSQSQAPAVTFRSNLNSPPSRTGTPDPDSEPKRKRISSQNFQRLARRISLTTRRQGSVSSIIPGLKRDSSPRISVDDGSTRGEGSGRNSNDSPATSIQGDTDSKNKKKDKKEKKEKTKKSKI